MEPLIVNSSGSSSQSETDSSTEGQKDYHYWTRSHSKRSLDSIGSEEVQSLKRRPGQNETQSASEIALNIGLVVDELFNYLDVPTLKTCRRVSKLWAYCGAKKLQRRKCAPIEVIFGHFVDESVKPVRDLLVLVENGEKDAFPVAAFDVTTRELGSPRIQHFFTVLGSSMKKLSLTLDYKNKKTVFEQATIMKDLKRILLAQALNLEYLEILFKFPRHWYEGQKELNSVAEAEDAGTNSLGINLPKLRKLSLYGLVVPYRFFRDVMNAAIYLQSFKGNIHGSAQLYEYFLSGPGRERVRLLQNLNFCCIEGTEIMERLLEVHNQNIKLKTFNFFNYLPIITDNTRPDLFPRVAAIMKQLLNSSSGTLRKLLCSSGGFLPGSFLSQLEFLLLVGLGDEQNADHYFQPGFKIAKLFPNLVSIGIIGPPPM